MRPFAHKSARTLAWYLALVLLVGAWSRHERLPHLADPRLAVLRELALANEPGADARGAQVLFLGSSRTARGLIPSVFENQLREAGGPEWRALNLAAFGASRQLSTLILEDWLRDHAAPRAVFVEVDAVQELVTCWPHPLLTRVMDAPAALRVVAQRPYLLRSQTQYARLLEDGADPFATGALRQLDRGGLGLELALETLGRGPQDGVRAGFNRLANGWLEFDSARTSGTGAWQALGSALEAAARSAWGQDPGFRPVAAQRVVDAQGWYRVSDSTPDARAGRAMVDAQHLYRSLATALADVQTGALDGSARHASTVLATERLLALCRERHIRVVFHELPGFRDAALGVQHARFYSERAELFRPDLEELWQPALYQDLGHLTVQGARTYSARLAAWFAGLPAAR